MSTELLEKCIGFK